MLNCINVAGPTDDDFCKAEALICWMYRTLEINTLDKIWVRTLLSLTKPEDHPPTSNIAYHHICRSFHQASGWTYALVNQHANLPNAVAYGGFTEEGDKLLPIIITKEVMPVAVLNVITCNCNGDCSTKRCLCQKSLLECTLQCHKYTQYSHMNCINMSNWIGC